MKQYISYKDEKYYTYMLKVINSIGGKNLKYKWLITDIEAYPKDNEIDRILKENEYLILSNNELIDIFEKEDFQWIWAMFLAIPEKYSDEEIIKYEIPSIHTAKKYTMPHPLAEIEIRCEDSELVAITSEKDEIIERFKKAFPLSVEKI